MVSVENDEELDELIVALAERLGHFSTEDEIYVFIFGTDEDRTAIYNQVDV